MTRNYVICDIVSEFSSYVKQETQTKNWCEIKTRNTQEIVTRYFSRFKD